MVFFHLYQNCYFFLTHLWCFIICSLTYLDSILDSLSETSCDVSEEDKRTLLKHFNQSISQSTNLSIALLSLSHKYNEISLKHNMVCLRSYANQRPLVLTSQRSHDLSDEDRRTLSKHVKGTLHKPILLERRNQHISEQTQSHIELNWVHEKSFQIFIPIHVEILKLPFPDYFAPKPKQLLPKYSASPLCQVSAERFLQQDWWGTLWELPSSLLTNPKIWKLVGRALYCTLIEMKKLSTYKHKGKKPRCLQLK